MKDEQIFKDRRDPIYELRAKNEKMTARERTVKAFNFEEADRIPIENKMMPEITKRCMEYWGCESEEELLGFLGADIRGHQGIKYVGPDLRNPDGTVSDIWGIRKKMVTYGKGTTHEGMYKETEGAPPLEKMTTVEEIEKYANWPSADWWNYSEVKEGCSYWHPEYFVLTAKHDANRTAQLKPIMALRGIQQAYIDLVQNPKIVECLRDHIVNYFLECNPRLFQAADGEIDMFMMGDDLGGQRGPLMSLEMWRRYFKDGFRRYIETAHSFGIKVMYHTCGDVYMFIPDFIECGLDCLQSIQPEATNMDIKRLKKEFGKYLSFQGGISVQQVMPLGSPEDVKKAVKYVADNAKQGGGYIFCTAHNTQADTPVENVVALYQAYHEYGNY